MVSSVTITNSGSGYDFVPAVSFKNPGGAEITDPTIDSEGRLVVGSITIPAAKNGQGYENPPYIYLDPPPVGGIQAAASTLLTPEGQVSSVLITNRGRGYLTPPRARIIQPIGAQVLGVTVTDQLTDVEGTVIGGGEVTDIELLLSLIHI